MTLSKKAALEAYARMLNRLDVRELENLLADDFQYSSQWVLPSMTSKAEYLRYISKKLDAIRASHEPVYAEMATLDREFPGPCVVCAQGEKDNLLCLVLAKVDGHKLLELSMCCAPSPHAAKRTGWYPGLDDQQHPRKEGSG